MLPHSINVASSSSPPKSDTPTSPRSPSSHIFSSSFPLSSFSSTLFHIAEICFLYITSSLTYHNPILAAAIALIPATLVPGVTAVLSHGPHTFVVWARDLLHQYPAAFIATVVWTAINTSLYFIAAAILGPFPTALTLSWSVSVLPLLADTLGWTKHHVTSSSSSSSSSALYIQMLSHVVAALIIVLGDHDLPPHHHHPHHPHRFSRCMAVVLLLLHSVSNALLHNYTRRRLSRSQAGARPAVAMAASVAGVALLLPIALLHPFSASSSSSSSSSSSISFRFLFFTALIHIAGHAAVHALSSRLRPWRGVRWPGGGGAVASVAGGTMVAWGAMLGVGTVPLGMGLLLGGGTGGVSWLMAALLTVGGIGGAWGWEKEKEKEKNRMKGEKKDKDKDEEDKDNDNDGDLGSIGAAEEDRRKAIIAAVKFVLRHEDSRRLFIFLCLNLVFMLVELGYGLISNSLGLISDSAHMLLDCSALAVSLYASYMAHWKADHRFTYGYGRYEVLAGFVNGVLLVLIGVYVGLEAMSRVTEPPEVGGDQLLLVSVIGLGINIVGIVFFHDHHHHHDHGGDGHHHHDHHEHHDLESGEHHHHHHHHHHNDNMHGVFLHILADALGSVGVIISTLLIQYLGWHLADPVCSLMIAGLILVSSIPLIRHTAAVLIHITPSHLRIGIHNTIAALRSHPSIISVGHVAVWTHDSNTTVAVAHIEVTDDADEQGIMRETRGRFNALGIDDVTIQVQKRKFTKAISTGSGFVNIAL